MSFHASFEVNVTKRGMPNKVALAKALRRREDVFIVFGFVGTSWEDMDSSAGDETLLEVT